MSEKMRDMRWELRWLELSRNGAAVVRWHTRRTINLETVGQHTYGALEVLWVLVQTPRVEAVRALMLHDIDEQFTGDVPAPAKWQSPEMAELLDGLGSAWVEANIPVVLRPSPALMEYERLAIKLADVIDMMLFALDERMLGNRALDDVFSNAVEAALMLVGNSWGEDDAFVSGDVRDVAERALGLIRCIEAQWKGMTQ